MAISSDGTTRRALLDLVKRRGSADATELAAALGVTVAGVRRHLDALVGDGLLTATVERRPKGRPAARFALTEAGDETFPRGYAELADAVLDAVADTVGAEAVERFLTLAARTVVAAVPPAAGRPLAEAVADLAAAADSAGYVAESTPLDEDSALLVEHNCAIARIAGRWPQACAAELAAFEAALGASATVERVRYIPDGDHTCTYLVRRRAGG